MRRANNDIHHLPPFGQRTSSFQILRQRDARKLGHSGHRRSPQQSCLQSAFLQTGTCRLEVALEQGERCPSQYKPCQSPYRNINIYAYVYNNCSACQLTICTHAPEYCASLVTFCVPSPAGDNQCHHKNAVNFCNNSKSDVGDVFFGFDVYKEVWKCTFSHGSYMCMCVTMSPYNIIHNIIYLFIKGLHAKILGDIFGDNHGDVFQLSLSRSQNLEGCLKCWKPNLGVNFAAKIAGFGRDLVQSAGVSRLRSFTIRPKMMGSIQSFRPQALERGAVSTSRPSRSSSVPQPNPTTSRAQSGVRRWSPRACAPPRRPHSERLGWCGAFSDAQVRGIGRWLQGALFWQETTCQPNEGNPL
jgi:hypothetical protein